MKYWYIIIVLFIMLTACGNRDEEVIEPVDPEQQEIQTTESVMFQEMDITTDGEQIHIIGQVKTSGNVFFYRIEQDNEVIQEEKKVELEAETEAFQRFEIMTSLSSDILEQAEPPFIVMYGKDEDGEEVNPNYVPIDTSIK